MYLKTTHIIDPKGNPHQVTKEAFCWQTKLVVHLLWVDEAAPPVRTGAWRSPTMPEAIVAFYQSSSPNRGHLSAYKIIRGKVAKRFRSIPQNTTSSFSVFSATHQPTII